MTEGRLFDSAHVDIALRQIHELLTEAGATDIVRQRNAVIDRVLFKHGRYVYGLYLPLVGERLDILWAATSLAKISCGASSTWCSKALAPLSRSSFAI